MTKVEEIYERHIGSNADLGYIPAIKQDILDAINEALNQSCQTAVMRMMAVSFAKWLRDNTVADGAPKLLLRLDMKRYTIEELYDLYTLIAE